MIKIVFVCLGNICRSPMAEMMFKELVKKNNLQNIFRIESKATSYEEERNGVHYGAIEILKRHGIPIENHKANRLQKEDYDKYDCIIGMDDSNIYNIMRIIGEDPLGKVHKLLDFSPNPRDIADPWYTGNFVKTYNDLEEGLKEFFNYLIENIKR